MLFLLYKLYKKRKLTHFVRGGRVVKFGVGRDWKRVQKVFLRS